jgi:hypothetical protein
VMADANVFARVPVCCCAPVCVQIGDLDGSITTDKLKETFRKFGPIIDDETFVKGPNGRFVCTHCTY